MSKTTPKPHSDTILQLYIKQMSDISKGSVYKIICGVSNCVYVGSTFDTLRNRWQMHKKHFNEWIARGRSGRSTSIMPYFEKHGIENFKIILIKSYDCVRTNNKDRKHLNAYEQLWINVTKCVNLSSPLCLLKKEKSRWYKEDNKERLSRKYEEYKRVNKDKISLKGKLYRLANKERIAASKRAYEKENKERIAIRRKEYHDRNKDLILAKKRVYNQQNQDTISKRRKAIYAQNITKHKLKTMCACGSTIRKSDLSRHKKTIKHKMWETTLSTQQTQQAQQNVQLC